MPASVEASVAAASAVDVSLEGLNVSSEAEAAEAAEELRRARAKEKKKRQKAGKKDAAAPPRQSAEYVNRTQRATAGAGRGQGLFATQACLAGQVLVRARPALSTLFDASSTTTCGFCFKAVPRTSADVSLNLQKGADGRIGIYVDEADVDGVLRAVFTGTADGSANAEAGVLTGDVVEKIGLTTVPTGPGCLQKCMALLAAQPAAFGAVVRRSKRGCVCGRFAACHDCESAGRGDWHRKHECAAYSAMPAAAKRGETSPIRMMLRYRATAATGDWAPPCPSTDAPEACGDKEALALVATLQMNTDVVPEAQKKALGQLTGVPPDVVSLLIGQIRSNAASIVRSNNKVGCALSVHMGYTNHSCSPNAAAQVDESGFVTLTALRPLASGEEVTISYMDTNADVVDRRNTLKLHYEFDCACERCANEHRDTLKQKTRRK
ncbi:hypothetical protein M885DRAFT_512124 [Pelagophyceae sp. CCMP2097]|nr:hypothetical protein M885DRAFT_512124 [Pelagophyceae sp. CCMP2097]|mmetsp:Transcript_16752/g.56598  ORF Transcript_16752/g.56598 Transcript_16752/m.56598 type:complete len:437 (-) Transcript_16752:141-1451(-)